MNFTFECGCEIRLSVDPEDQTLILPLYNYCKQHKGQPRMTASRKTLKFILQKF